MLIQCIKSTETRENGIYFLKGAMLNDGFIVDDRYKFSIFGNLLNKILCMRSMNTEYSKQCTEVFFLDALC